MVRFRPLAVSTRLLASPTIGLGARVRSSGVAPAPSPDSVPDVRRDLVDGLSANGAFSSDEKIELCGDLDACSPCFAARAAGRFGARKGGSESAAETGALSSRRCHGSSGTRLGRIRPLGCDAATTDEPSICCDANAAAAARCGSGSNAAFEGWVSDDIPFWFEVVASLGRRRTSTVNDGTARLNVVLA